MNDIRTITLDLDDTLWAIHPVIKRAEQRLYAWMGENYPRITELFGPRISGEMRKRVVDESAHVSHDLTFLRRTVLTRLGEAAGYGDAMSTRRSPCSTRRATTSSCFPKRGLRCRPGRTLRAHRRDQRQRESRQDRDRDLFDGIVIGGNGGRGETGSADF